MLKKLVASIWLRGTTERRLARYVFEEDAVGREINTANVLISIDGRTFSMKD